MSLVTKGTLLITGASGFIGGHLAKQAGGAWSVAGTCRRFSVASNSAGNVDGLVTLDITDKSRVISVVEEISPSVIIHCAAVSSVEYCAVHKELAHAVNIAGTENMALASAGCGAHFIFISSDQVFDGSAGCYSETDEPKPISFYGETKLEGERIVRGISDSYTIARLSLCYGKSVNNSVSFLDKMICTLERKEGVTLFFDEFRSPAYVQDICTALLALAENRASGIFHLAGPERLSRLDFGYKVVEFFGFDKSLITVASSDLFGFLDRRPKDCSLISRNLISPTVRFRTVIEGLADCKVSSGA